MKISTEEEKEMVEKSLVKMRGVDGRICEEFSMKYYGICTIGGMLSAGTTHLAITPLDVLKVNMQVSINYDLVFQFLLNFVSIFFLSILYQL